MNEKEFNGLILAELVKIANDVFTNEIEIAPGTYTAAELAKLKDANGNEINIKYLCVDAKLNITDFRTVQINSFKCSFPVDQVFNLVWQFEYAHTHPNYCILIGLWFSRCLSSYINMNELSAESLCPNY